MTYDVSYSVNSSAFNVRIYCLLVFCAVSRNDIKLKRCEVNSFVASCRLFMANNVIY